VKAKNSSVNLLLSLGILWIVFGCSVSNSNDRTNPTSKEITDSAPASISIGAAELVVEFEGNQVRANEMYGGKRVRVNGAVNSIEILKDGRITLTFHSPARGYAMTRCYFNNSQSSRIAKFAGGQEAIVEGTVRGLVEGRGYVELEDCIVP
jgi:hypothetical protein